MATPDSVARGEPRGRALADDPKNASDDSIRRAEILATAESLIASSGLRTSVTEIADAVGILPGSLYHHFESKEAILVELIRRYQADLDRVGEIALARLDEGHSRPIPDQILELSIAIAGCAVQHRAALQMSFYEGPSAEPQFVELTHRRSSGIQQAMLQTLRAGKYSGYIRDEFDLPILADRFCSTMLQVGLDVIRHNAPPAQVATVLCRIMLHGLASRPPSDAELDRSSALAAANDVIQTWAEDDEAETGDKAAHVRAVARTLFGRKGYEVTTIRDIASASGLGHGSVYRLIGSKDELLASIMQTFGKRLEAGWIGVLRSDATTVEKLDALSWLNTNVLDQFPDEFRIQLAWMRQSPPDSPNVAWSFSTRLRQLKSLLTEGIRSGQMSIDAPSTAMLARCVLTVHWIPEDILHATGKRASLVHLRDTLLRGVTDRTS